MKYLYIIILLLVISCKNKVDKGFVKNETLSDSIEKEQDLKEKLSKKMLFYNKGVVKSFNFDNKPLLKDIDEISNNNTEEFNVNIKLEKSLLEKENYYKLINYNNITENRNFKVFTVFGNYDYYTNILLVILNVNDDSLIDYKTIASIMGDADNTIEVSSSFLDSTTIEIITNKKRLAKNADGFELLDSKNETFRINAEGKMIQLIEE